MLATLRKFFLGTLRRRLIFGVAAVQAVLMLLFIADLARRHSTLLTQRQREQVTASVHTLAGAASGLMASNDLAALQELVEAQRRTPGLRYAMFLDEDGHILAHTDALRVGQYLRDLPPLAQKGQVLQKGMVLEGFAPIMIANHHLGWIYLSMDQREAQGRLAGLTRDGVLYSLVAILVGSLLAWLLGSRVVRRLSVLQSAIHKVQEGGAHVRSTLTGTDEVAALSIDFNRMLDQLDQRDSDLKQSEEAYRRQFTDNTAIMLMIDPSEGRILEANTAAATFYGYSREQLRALRITDINLLPPGGVQVALGSVGANQSKRFVFQHRLADGSVRDVEVSASSIQWGNREVVHSIIHDITERTQAETALRETNELLALFVHHSPIYTYIKEVTPTESRTLHASENFEQMIGIKGSDMVGKTMAELFPADLAAKTLVDDLAVIAGGKTLEVEEELNGRRYSTLKFPIVQHGKTLLAGFTIDITERKQAEDELRTLTNRFSLAVRAGGVGIWDWDIVNNHLVWDDQMYGLYGTTSEQFTGAYEAWQAGVHPEDADQGDAEIQMALRGEKEFDSEFRVIWADGSIHYIRALALILRDASGQPVRMTGTNWDITERKQAEDSLRESKERLEFALQGGELGTWDYYPKTGTVLYGDLWARMLEYQPEEVESTMQFFRGHIHPDDIQNVFDRVAKHVDGFAPSYQSEHRLRTKSGRWIWVADRGKIAERDPEGHPLRITGIITDITERKQAEEKLSNNERRLKSIFAAMTEGFSIQEVVCDETGRPCDLRFIEANPAFELQTGLKNADTLGHTLLELFPQAESYWIERYEKVGLTGEPTHFEANFGPLGKCYQVSTFQTEPGRFGTLFTDINERKQAEEEKAKLQAQLQQSQKMESLGTLAGGVAHDMNNVLGAILGLASAQIGTQPYGSPLHQALDTICKATERGGKMVRSLLSFARQSPAESHKLNMNAILREQVSLLERTTLAKVRLQIDLEVELRPILGDASALTHAFMNLCVNAVDAMPENGTLTLRTRNVDNDWIEVVVEDTGTGMPKEVLEKAMEPFFTTKGIGKGTGLGLSMVFSTVKAHRGQMDIHSEPGRGTRVMLRFPAFEQKTLVQDSAPGVADVTLPPHGTLKVLLVDDDELIQTSTQMVLEVLGQTTVNTALSGEEALAMLEAGFEPDLVILDMNMPGLGGIGTLPRLRVLRPEVPVLLATGRVDQTALTLASAHPGVTLLSKPFGLRELQKHLESIGLG